MPILLDDDDVRRVLTMEDCLGALEAACKQEALGTAANRTKSTLYVRPAPGGFSQYVSMEGALREPPVFALRVRVHGAGAEGAGTGAVGAHVLMLFGAEGGELLAILKQRAISSYRTAALAGLAGREMARPDAQVVGILGSGGMAHAHALAYAAVRNVERFKVYSPNPEHRAGFASWLSRTVGISADAAPSEEAVVRDADIVAACTNARGAIVHADWLDRPGVHMTGVQLGDQGELEPGGLRRFQRVVTYLSGVSTHHNTEPGQQPLTNATTETSLDRFEVIPNHHSLADLLLGKAPGRESPEESNYFFSEGTGVQFAAVGALVYQRARDRNIGQPMPDEWARWFATDRPVSTTASTA